MPTVTNPATTPQRAWVRDIAEKRLLPSPDINEALLLLVEREDFPREEASKIIDRYKNAPRKPGVARVAPAITIPKSKYAVPTGELGLVGRELAGANDHIFCEVKEWKGTVYMRQLHGAPGSFTRSKLASEQVKDLNAIIAADPLHYTQLFGELYTCCGCCGAELTDETSRQLKLGPTCRGRFGL